MNGRGVNIAFQEATAGETDELQRLALEVIDQSPGDPNLASFRHALDEGHSANERFVEYSARVRGRLAGRSEINFRPQDWDVCAYGHEAAQLHTEERMAALAGDLVLPAFRGLGVQSQMIERRLALLSDQRFSYAVCGIRIGNDISRTNYQQLGFAPIGEKTIDWGPASAAGRLATVVLYGLRLAEPVSRD